MIKKILAAPFLIVFFIMYLFFGGFTMIISDIIDKLLNWVEIGSESRWEGIGEAASEWLNGNGK